MDHQLLCILSCLSLLLIWAMTSPLECFLLAVSNHIIFSHYYPNLYSLFFFIFISWRLMTSQHFRGFCHTLTWISHGVTCIPHPDPPSHLPLHPIPLGLPSAPGLRLVSCIPPGLIFFTIDNIHAVLSKHPTLAFSHRVQQSVLYICVSFSVLHIGLSLPSF